MSEDTRSMHQPALDGLAVRKSVSKSAQKAREKAEADNKPAAHQPIARVVLDIQTPHLGKLFDYVIPEKVLRNCCAWSADSSSLWISTLHGRCVGAR